ncbi:small nuclear ribonucleoprotein f [Anaeramoeba flamelloides]|uniref:Sm protein F n=1 Tax=Anaeramoeba flamelloides TaxID=1746091 RepID=A0AAV8A8G8_9EUKA|nr:small nuclear ribonucleoprotein f [Anaeramoeba flamelloides]KAJ6250569.1 small nuclear ribonucleoprotein f [Anaeramoeba flamelloides]
MSSKKKSKKKDQFPLNPKPFLEQLLGCRVVVKLKWGEDYRGELFAFDEFMNFHLVDATEYLSGEENGYLGEILIRCNNVLYIREDFDFDEKKNDERKAELEDNIFHNSTIKKEN